LILFSKAREEYVVIKSKEKEMENKIQRLRKIATCPICLRPMSQKEATKIIMSLKSDFDKETGKKLQELTEKIKKIGYDKIKHAKIKTEIGRLSHFEEEQRKLDIVSETKKEKKEQMEKIKTSIVTKRKEYKKILTEKKALRKEKDKLEPKELEYKKQEELVLNIRDGVLEIKGTYGAFKQRIIDLEEQEKLCDVKIKQLEELKVKTQTYKEVGEIFSKKGLQTMIIETILPEIEHEANDILERITDGKMQFKFLTTREKKSGEGEIETLDIKIQDAFGERGYELYSGGEAFRIDLAIRVALSKVLSKRAGTKLQFLAIDEGFGSLDQAGKDEVVDAIIKLKGDFEKILIVTHIQELKNLFPTRIEVEKDENGSHLEIISV